MKKVIISAYGFTGIGDTKTAAKADLEINLAAALAGDYSPVILNFKGNAVLIARCPRSGWGYRIIWAGDTTLRHDSVCAIMGSADRDGTIEAAISHLADVVRQPNEPMAVTMPLIECIRNSKRREEVLKALTARFQRNDLHYNRTQFAQNVLGLEKNDSYNWGGMNPMTYKEWSGTERLGVDIDFPTVDFMMELIQSTEIEGFQKVAEGNPAIQQCLACIRMLKRPMVGQEATR